MRPLKIGIIGGGVGGLSLAQALHKQGVSAVVFERDPTPSFRRQGYRVTVHEDGATHLEACLPPHLYQMFLDRSYRWNGFQMMDKGLSVVADIGGDFLKSRSIDRAALREILLTGLPDVRFGKEFSHYELSDDEVRLTFSDGAVETFDLVVGADGNQSRVRKLRLPAHAELSDTGYVDIAARLPWSPTVQALIDGMGIKSLNQILSEAPETMIIIPQMYNAPGDDPTKGYLYWGLIGRRDKVARIAGDVASGDRLKFVATTLTQSFHPLLRQMVASTAADEISLLSFFTSVRPDPWPTNRVTLIGDAIHAMPPMAGAGANTAIRDANELSKRLIGAGAGSEAPLAAVAQFEEAMRDYGFAAVAVSNKNLLRATTGSSMRKRLELFAMKLIQRAAPGLLKLKMR